MNRPALASHLVLATLLVGCYSNSSKQQRAREYAPYTAAVAEQGVTKARIAHFEKVGDTAAARLEREVLAHQEQMAKSAHGVAQNPALVVPQVIMGSSTARDVKELKEESQR
jgi:hypothetical protein